MKSSQRSLALHGHKTSISLEADFWTALRKIAEERDETLSSLVRSIDTKRHHANLSQNDACVVQGERFRKIRTT